MLCRYVGIIVFAVGCATPEYVVIGGARVARPSVAYDNGTSFHLEHNRAYPGVFDPRRPQDVSDGTIEGRICGIDLRFDASWYGSRLMVQGRGDVPWLKDYTRTEGDFRLDLDVNELGPSHHRIRGSAPPARGGMSTELDIDVSPLALVAHIGQREFELTASGEYLVGRYKRHGDVRVPFDVPYAIYGRQVLASMVPADQALLLTLMLSCNGPAIEHDGKMVRGFSMVSLPPKSP
ncbi:MAG TPA: hypothetical protein VGL86_29250 [Polyangia bacterium]|jgi:hypothetical protein